MKRERRPILRTLLRSLRLRCPVCGKSSIIQRPFKIKHHCPACEALFLREEGFFVGAILINVVTTEALILALYLGSLVAGFDYQIVLTVLFLAALTFPVIFYHHSWSLWLGFDYLIESLPKNAEGDSSQTQEEDEWPDQIAP